MGKISTQFELELVRQFQMVIMLEKHLFVQFNKKDAILDYVRTNNSHVMWTGDVIDTFDDYDIVNVVFQFKHLNKIIARLEMFGPFLKVTLKG